MPELPEVEIVRRGLEPVLAGRRIARVRQNRPDLRFPFPDRFASRLEGRTVEALERRAKYLLAPLDSGETLLMHLGMTGRFSIVPPKAAVVPLGTYVQDSGGDPRHDHLELSMEDGTVIVFNDPRRFGFVLLIPAGAAEVHPLLSGLGPEPLGPGFTTASLARAAAGRGVDLKALLLDQRAVAGLGNIYVSEALHRAGLSPRRSARSLARADGTASARALRLVPAVRSVLSEAIEAGGSTLRDYRQTDGSNGRFQERFAVYDRDGERCPRPGCDGVIRRMVQHGRATFWCPRCQR